MLFKDPLLNDKSNNWQTNELPTGSCTFPGDGYQFMAPPDQGIPCLYSGKSTLPKDVAVEVTVKFVTGFEKPASAAALVVPGVALVVRADHTDEGYYFELNAAGQYNLEVAGDQAICQCGQGIGQGTLPATYVHEGDGSSNVLEMSIQGSTVEIFINGQFLDSARDTTFGAGLIGLDIRTGSGGPSEAVFSDMTVWGLP
ncbi:MAG: hypothetical protein ACLQUY_21475 [Ktedonobacterales bacterium]